MRDGNLTAKKSVNAECGPRIPAPLGRRPLLSPPITMRLVFFMQDIDLHCSGLRGLIRGRSVEAEIWIKKKGRLLML